ncbi:FHA domain-containing protein [Pantoea agglomerans]|uniref:FHA domain-containing protein n=1 Tax=Enterobacter agglomerans TaxID=549 RepID=UPI00301C2DA3
MNILINYTNLANPHLNKIYQLTKPGASIGTDSGCTIVIQSNTDEVDALHAMINLSDIDNCYLSNLSLTKPIFLNDESLKFAKQTLLNSSDKIKIGNHIFHFSFSNQLHATYDKMPVEEAFNYSSADRDKMWKDLDNYLNITDGVSNKRKNLLSTQFFANEFSSKNINPSDPLSEISHDFNINELKRDKPDILTFFEKEEDFGNGSFLFDEGTSTISKDYNESMSWQPKNTELIVDPLYHFDDFNYKWSDRVSMDAHRNIIDAYPAFYREVEFSIKNGDKSKYYSPQDNLQHNFLFDSPPSNKMNNKMVYSRLIKKLRGIFKKCRN